MTEQEPQRDLLITGSRVWTGIPATPWAEAVLTRGDRIRYVGSEAEARQAAGPAAEHIHVPGGLVTAGLNDSHLHTDWGGYDLTILNLEGITTPASLQQRLRDYADANPDKVWIEGYGLPYEALTGLYRPEREVLDDAVPDRPVHLKAFDSHSGWCNSEGLRRAGIERGAAIALPNEVVVDPDSGLATGMLKEGANELVTRIMTEPSEAEKEVMLRNALRYLNSLGITSIQNMKEDLGVLQRYARLRERGELTAHAYHYLIVEEDTPLDYLFECQAYTQQFSDHWNRTSGIKLFIDGVVESKTALMLDPYEGSNDTGVPNIEPEIFRRIVVAADSLDMDIAVHAIGDRGIRLTLDAYEAAQQQNGGRRGRRHRVEHIETVQPSDIPRLGQLGITASMQPLHAAPTTDPRFTPWTKLIGPVREPYSFPWRRLRDTGAVLAFGSDWPVVTPDVRIGLHTAITRRNPAGEPAGGWQPQHCVTLAEALQAYTRGAAYAERQEHVKGTLRPGMFADVTVFDRDLFTLHPADILTTGIAATVVGGRVVHRQEAAEKMRV